jgi:ribonuclease HII
MGYLIGTDEAGYGPNLGPLVISATVWETPDRIGCEDLFEHVHNVIAQKPDRVDANGGPCVAMADSKILYSPGKGLRNLERGLLSALGLLNYRPRCWRDVWRALAPDALTAMPKIPWLADYDAPAPLDCTAEEIEAIVEPLRVGLAAVGVRLAAVRSRAIFEEEFNDLLDQHGSKGAALSHQTLGLVAQMIDGLPTGPISVVCDKHGGRNVYGPLLMAHFPDWLIEVRGESRARSVYRFGPPERRVEFCFRVKAESCLPAALASMASKFLRELAMKALNHYWRGHIPDLQPTAGYPQDAKRFRVDIAETQKRLKIADRVLWRAK